MAAAVAAPPGRAPWLAVALKPSKRVLRCVGRAGVVAWGWQWQLKHRACFACH